MFFKTKMSLIIVCVLTVGCSNVSSSWSCKNNINGTCSTIKEIEDGNTNKKNKKLKKNNFFNKDGETIVEKNKDKNLLNFDDYRSKESVSRVVFSPYVDEAGNRHDYSTVYYLEQKSEWKK